MAHWEVFMVKLLVLESWCRSTKNHHYEPITDFNVTNSISSNSTVPSKDTPEIQVTNNGTLESNHSVALKHFINSSNRDTIHKINRTLYPFPNDSQLDEIATQIPSPTLLLEQTLESDLEKTSRSYSATLNKLRTTQETNSQTGPNPTVSLGLKSNGTMHYNVSKGGMVSSVGRKTTNEAHVKVTETHYDMKETKNTYEGDYWYNDETPEVDVQWPEDNLTNYAYDSSYENKNVYSDSASEYVIKERVQEPVLGAQIREQPIMSHDDKRPESKRYVTRFRKYKSVAATSRLALHQRPDIKGEVELRHFYPETHLPRHESSVSSIVLYSWISVTAAIIVGAIFAFRHRQTITSYVLSHQPKVFRRHIYNVEEEGHNLLQYPQA